MLQYHEQNKFMKLEVVNISLIYYQYIYKYVNKSVFPVI